MGDFDDNEYCAFLQKLVFCLIKNAIKLVLALWQWKKNAMLLKH